MQKLASAAEVRIRIGLAGHIDILCIHYDFTDEKLKAILEEEITPAESPEAWSVGGTTIIVTCVLLLIVVIVDMVTFARFLPLIVKRYKTAWYATISGIMYVVYKLTHFVVPDNAFQWK